MKQPVLLFLASAFALTACEMQTGNKVEQTQGTQAGISTAWMDKSVVPGDDFFAYANGTWVKNTPIPEDRSNIGGFYIADQER